MNTANTVKHLMLVEDHELTRLGLKYALNKYSDIKIIAETASGLEAIKLAKEVKPDVILMDIGLQGLDGIAATEEIKKESSTIKIIMLSSHEGEKEIFASFASGADGYAVKDSTPEQLYTAIGTVFQGDSWLSSHVAEKVLRNLYGVKPSKGTDQQKHQPIIPLSARELEILQLIVDGKSNQEIAAKLFVSLATIKSHVRNILTKLSVDDRTQAAVKAMRAGIVV